MRIRPPATALAFTVAFAFTVITGLVLYQARLQAGRLAAERSANIALILQRDLDRSINLLDLSVLGAAANHALIEQHPLAPATHHDVLQNGTEPAAEIGAVIILDERGALLFDSRSAQPRPRDFAERDYFKVHRDHTDAGMLVSLVERNDLADAPVLALSRRIDHPDGSFAGVAVGTIEVPTFQKLLGGVDIGPSGCLVLLAAGGRDVYRSNTGNMGFPDDPALWDAPDPKDGQAHIVRDMDGVSRLFTRYRLRSAPLSINVGLAQSDIYASWWVAAGIASAAAALLLTAAGWLTRSLRSEFARRERVELALRDSEANFRLLTQHGSDMVSRVGPDGERRYVSPASLRLLHAAPDRLLGRALLDYVHPDERPAFDALAARLLSGLSMTEPFTFRVASVGGSERWMEVMGQPLLHPATRKPDGYVAAWRDVTRRKLAERQLAESEARYRLLAETAGDLITCLDLQLQRTYVSPACRLVLGFEPEDMMRQTPAQLTHPDELAETGERLQRLVSGAVESDVITNRLRHKGGHYVWLEIKLALIRDPETRRPTGIMAVMRDVSDRKAQADALRDGNAELERLTRHLAHARDGAEQANQAKSRFLASVGHGLRAPLDGIVGSAQLLQITGGLSQTQLARVESMLTAGRRLLEMIDGVLDLVEVEADAVELDAAPARAPGVPPSPDQGSVCPPPATRGLRALVVDDMPLNRNIVATFLSAAGHHVTCAEGGEEAVLMASVSEFDVILMDIRMPEMDGLEAARRIRGFAGPRSRVPIIAMTVHAHGDWAARCCEAGIDQVLTTPFTRRSLLEALQRARGAAEVG